MSDIEILKEMIKDAATVPLSDYYEKKQVVLEEPPPGDYSVTIHNMPDDDEVIVIKADCFTSPKSVFANSKSECKRADFIIVANTDRDKIIIFIEMKANKGRSDAEIVQQLKGAQCFIAYCREIGQLFWGKSDFLTNYQYRFISIKDIRISKKRTITPHKTGIHDRPDRMLKISSPHHLEFKRLL